MFYHPFSELLDGDYFVFHPNHWNSDTESHTLFRKIDTARYQNPASNTVLVIPKHQIHKTEVVAIEIPNEAWDIRKCK